MKKYVLITAVFTACLSLWTAVWPQNKTVEKTQPTPTQAEVTVAPTPKIEIAVTEIEEAVGEITTPAPINTPVPTPTPATPPAAPQAVQTGNMVYVPGFGWLESQGEGTVTYAEDMYENGNTVGIMD